MAALPTFIAPPLTYFPSYSYLFLQLQQLCDNETQYMGIFCGYHYSPVGVSILANKVAETITQLLGAA